MKMRISLVHYLNAAPLGWAFLHGPFRNDFETVPSSPARCAEQLSSGEVEIGLIPSIEYQRIPGLQIIPGISISSLEKVRSVLLIKPKGIRNIRSVALDTSSRTSVAFTKVLLEAKLGLHPEYVPHAPDLSAMLHKCDAALLIGDAALQIRPEDYEVLDLAEEWTKWQQTPFVTAFWACRADVPVPEDMVVTFQRAKEYGLQERPEIAVSFAKSLNLPAAFLERYLHENIDYALESRHVEGLQRFYQLAHAQDLIPGIRPFRFLE
jgi:chorismate dehydratase